MRKTISYLICLLFALTALYPVGILISGCFGYAFELSNISAFAITIAVLSLCVVILDLIFKAEIKSKTVAVLASLFPLLPLVNAMLCILGCGRIWVIAGVALSVGCGFFFAVKHGAPPVLKIVSVALSVLMLFPMFCLSFFCLIFAGFATDTVLERTESPDGTHSLVVTYCDQGALGGDVLVEVYENGRLGGFDAAIFKVEKKPQRLYYGKSAKAYWKSDRCLVVNSVEYEID